MTWSTVSSAMGSGSGMSQTAAAQWLQGGDTMKLTQLIGVTVAVGSALVGGSLGAQALASANAAPLAAGYAGSHKDSENLHASSVHQPAAANPAAASSAVSPSRRNFDEISVRISSPASNAISRSSASMRTS